MTLSDLERDLLRKLANGDAVSLHSNIRLRLEMAGVIRDSASGVVLTEAGRRFAKQADSDDDSTASARAPKVPLDRRGRRMPRRRQSPF